METIQINRCVCCMADIPVEAVFCPHCGKNPRVVDQPAYCLRPFSILRGKYMVGRMLGRGGFGITYVGWDMALEAKVAIKECYPGSLAVRDGSVSNLLQWDTSLAHDGQWRASCESFLREARKMAKIRDVPEVVRVLDTFEENNTAYIVMDFVEGITLKEWLEKNGSLTPDGCVELLRPLMTTLSRIHQQGIIHRDISPDNIMIRADGSIKLLDLGAAKELTPQHSHHSLLVTKNGFSPVEQYTETGKIGPWTDVYALCATLYYCMTGKTVPPALDRLDDPLPLQFQREDFKEPLPEAMAAALISGLAIRASDRTQSVDELLRQLESGGAPEPVIPPTEAFIPPAEPVIPPTEAFIPPAEPVIPPTEAFIPPAEPVIPPTEAFIPPAAPAAPQGQPVNPEFQPAPTANKKRPSKVGLNIVMMVGGLVILYDSIWYVRLSWLINLAGVILAAAGLATAVQVIRSRQTPNPRLKSNLFLTWEVALIAMLTVDGLILLYEAWDYLDWWGSIPMNLVLGILCCGFIVAVLIVRLSRKLRAVRNAPASTEPDARAGQDAFQGTLDLLQIFFWIFVAAAAALVLLSLIIADTYQMVLSSVPGMLLSAIFYIVSAVFVFRCRRRIWELPDARLADGVRRTAVFFGTLILIHVLLTALHQIILWFNPYLISRLLSWLIDLMH